MRTTQHRTCCGHGCRSGLCMRRLQDNANPSVAIAKDGKFPRKIKSPDALQNLHISKGELAIHNSGTIWSVHHSQLLQLPNPTHEVIHAWSDMTFSNTCNGIYTFWMIFLVILKEDFPLARLLNPWAMSPRKIHGSMKNDQIKKMAICILNSHQTDNASTFFHHYITLCSYGTTLLQIHLKEHNSHMWSQTRV